jgi:hypothetical protein
MSVFCWRYLRKQGKKDLSENSQSLGRDLNKVRNRRAVTTSKSGR